MCILIFIYDGFCIKINVIWKTRFFRFDSPDSALVYGSVGNINTPDSPNDLWWIYKKLGFPKIIWLF